MIFVDTNVLYSVLVQTKFTKFAQDIILMKSDLATSSTVLGELVFISLRKLCKERYGTKNYSEFRRVIVQRGYGPFKGDLGLIFRFIKESNISILPINDDQSDWSNAMIRYNLLPNDAMIASTCLKHRISEIATFDSDFLRVDWLSVVNQANEFTGLPAKASLRGLSTVSIFCMGMADPAMSTGRRAPYSSYLPSQTSSVFLPKSGWGFSGPQRVDSGTGEGLPDKSEDREKLYGRLWRLGAELQILSSS